VSWIIERTGPGVKDNEVQLGAFRGTCVALATVNGVREWTTRPDAEAALVTYREALKREADAGQKEMFG
jgi:hypothetical protein